MTKANTLRLKTRTPEAGLTIEVELTDGTWEQVYINGHTCNANGVVTSLMLEYDDGSFLEQVNAQSLSWRWPPQ